MSLDQAELLVPIAREAASLINDVYGTTFDVDYKGPNDPVTAADRRANELICRRLAELFPGVPVVAEESEPASFEGFRKADRIFFVDPLDGTREFVARNGEFVVMIGLVEGSNASCGVIHAPATGVTWLGSVGDGAWSIDAAGVRRPIQVGSAETLAEARVVVSRSHRSEVLDQVLRLLGAREVIPVGSAGLKGAHVATGEADAYVSPKYAGKRWDACAADALVTAAGGRYTDAFGERIDYRAQNLANDRGILACNADLHAALLARFDELTRGPAEL